MFSFLQIKIYRGKFIAFTVFVLFMGLGLCALTCLILLDQWLDNVRNQSSEAFSRVESSLQHDSDRIEAFMQRVYSNGGLIADVRHFLGNSAQGYLTSRLENSRYDQPLVSFPDDMESYLGNGGQNNIVQVSLHTERQANVVRFDSNGNTSFRFGLPGTDETFRETIRKGFVIRKKLSDPNQISRQLGEFRFLIGSEHIFRTVEHNRWSETAAVSASGDVYLVPGRDRLPEKLFRRAAASGRSHGFLAAGPFDRAYFVTFHSNAFDYRYVSIVGLSSLIRGNAGVLLIVFLIILAAMISILLLIAYNMREDASFLRRIVHSIERVKTADFTPVQPARYRKNEYGMIAAELDDMTLQLNKHIRTEYLLKLKQQETEMKALQHQINPHFLYNTLEIIRSFALTNRAADTAEAIATLGSLYREIVKNENIVSMGSEIALLRKFLTIMEFKYPDNFYYQLNVDEALLPLPTVKFWMQPLAENFFVHGFNPGHEFNLLVVNGWEEEDSFVLEMVDNGTSISEDRLAEIRRSLTRHEDAPEESIGLRNVHTRLHFFYGKRFSMKVENNEKAGVKISVILPKEATRHVQASDRR